jgi:hypothetical protein
MKASLMRLLEEASAVLRRRFVSRALMGLDSPYMRSGRLVPQSAI